MEIIHANQYQELNSEKLKSAITIVRPQNDSPVLTQHTPAQLEAHRLRERFVLPSRFLGYFNADYQIMVMEGYPNIARATLDRRIPRLSVISMAFSRNTAIEFVYEHLNVLLQNCEQQTAVPDIAWKQFARLFVAKYHYLNIFEVMYFFAQCRLAVYGPFYGTTGPNQLAEMAVKFIEDRSNSLRAHSDQNGNYRA